MWYIIWVLCTLFACGCGIFTAMWFEKKDNNEINQTSEDQ